MRPGDHATKRRSFPSYEFSHGLTLGMTGSLGMTTPLERLPPYEFQIADPIDRQREPRDCSVVITNDLEQHLITVRE